MTQKEALDMITKLQLAQQAMEAACKRIDELKAENKALKKALAQPEQEPMGHTDQQIVDQTEELAVWLLSWCFNHQPETKTPMRESAHPFAQRCWAAACHIQEMLTATDPENSVAELDGEPNEDTSPPPQRKPLTDEEYKFVLAAIAEAEWMMNTHMTECVHARDNIRRAGEILEKAAHGIKE